MNPNQQSPLNNLLNTNSGAREYFNSLPYFAKETFMQSYQNIQTEEELRQCADNLTQP